MAEDAKKSDEAKRDDAELTDEKSDGAQKDVEPEAEKNGLSTHTSASSGSCQASPRAVARTPRASSENARAPPSDSPTRAGWTASIVSRAVPAKRVAGTAACQESKGVGRAGATFFSPSRGYSVNSVT